MAYLIHYTGEGQVRMTGVTEYVVIADIDEATEEELAVRCCPGFRATGVFVVMSDECRTRPSDEGRLPLDRELVSKF